MALSREQVVATAVGLLDEVGLEGLTLRRLAAELGVQAPTLYWHVRDKRQLLDLMSEAIVREAVPEPLVEPRAGQSWWDWLTERAVRHFQALQQHRDAALVVAGKRPTEQSLPDAERVLASLVAVGFPPDEALRTLMTLTHYVMGCVLEYQAEAARSEDPERDRDLASRLHDERDLPLLSEAVADFHDSGRHESFEHGLGLIVAGLRERQRQLAGSRLPAASP